MNLHGKTLLITGASRGIGLAIALRASGVTDLDHYAVQPGAKLLPDWFLDR